MIRSLGYLRIEATDVEAWRSFGVKVLGMVEGRGPDPETLYLRMDDFPARLVIVPGDKDRLLVCGYEVTDSASLAEIGRTLEDAGLATKQASADELAERRVGELVRVDDPFGNTVELFTNAALDGRPAISHYGNRFVTGDGGLGHVVLSAPREGGADAAGLAFYGGLLGFQLRDTMRLPAELIGLSAEDGPVWMRFMGPGPRHHSVAFAPIPAPTGIVHVMLEVETLDDVGRALDRCQKHGAPLVSTLGRHANDNMVSFYLRTPSGFDIEYGTGGLLVDSATWVSRETTAHTVWGHRFLRGAAH